MGPYEESNEVIGDIISRLIGGDMTGGDEWRPAATLDFLVQSLVRTVIEGGESAEFAQDLLGDIMLSLLYLELAESDAEQAAYDRQWEQIVANVLRSDKNNEEDEEDGDEGDE